MKNCSQGKQAGSANGRRRAVSRLKLGICALGLGTAALVQAQDPVWSVQVADEGGRRQLIVESAQLRAEFLAEYAWMLARVFFEGVPVVGWTGSNGAVVSLLAEAPWERPQEGWIGSGHGGEQLISYAIEADGVAQPYDDALELKASEIRLVKISEMGPFVFHHTVSFPASGDRLVQEHRFTVRDGSEWFRHMYAFMHQVVKPFNDWLAWRPDGTTRAGATGLADGRRSLQEDVRAVAFYAQEQGLGVVICYADAYPGRNRQGHFINDRTHDNKLYFQPQINPADLTTAKEFVFRASLIPFRAAQDSWADQADRIVRAAGGQHIMVDKGLMAE
ncbi:MAG: hypothetical protein K9N49_05665 [Candidatus Marinimicrobia bacterium]|nr:hypothetical protein [Candidatus Neomarinimicrobiota bacterium]